MPNLLIPIKQTADSVSRRVYKSVIDKVIHITDMDTTRIELRGDLGVATQPGGELGDVGKTNRYLHEGRVIVTARETYRDSEVINAAVRDPDMQPIFEDRSIGIHIKPVYSYTDVELQFLYRAPTKQAATAWRDDIKIRLADNRQQHLHELDYHYPIPPWCAGFLKHVYTLREAVGGYGDTLGDYLRGHYTQRATVVTTLDGDMNKSLLVIAEKQIGVQGWFDFIEPVEEEKNEDGPTWNIQFTYRFNYKKPLEINVQYPLVIHNQLISGDYIVKPYDEDPDKKQTIRGEFKLALDTFDYEARRAPRKLGGIMIPNFDEWIPDTIPNFTTSFITWMTVIEPKDLNLFLSEQDILDTGFHPLILKYMRDNLKNLGRRGKCALHFALYRDREAIADGDLEFVLTDKAFTVRSISQPDIRENYHVRLSFCTNSNLYTEEALDYLHENGYTALILFQTVINSLDVEFAQQEHLTEDGKLSAPYIDWFYDFLYDQTIGRHDPGSSGAPGGGSNTGPGAGGNGVNNDRTNPSSSGGGSNGGIGGSGNGNGNGSGAGGGSSTPPWIEDIFKHRGGLDVPYVEILTILVDRKKGV